VETIRLQRILLEDLDLGSGLREVRVADGRVLMLHQLSLAGLLLLRTVRLRPVAGEATMTASGLFLAGARIAGVTTEITRPFGTTNSLTGFAVGDGTVVDRWGTQTSLVPPAQTDQANFQAGDWPVYASGGNAVISALSGTFDANGEVEITAHYFLLRHRRG